MAGRFIAAESCPIYSSHISFLFIITGKHTRSRPPFLLHSASPGATFLLPSFSVHAPTCLHCQTQIPLSPKQIKGSFATLESQVPQGSIYPTGTRFHIPDFSLISGSSGDKASTWSRGPVTRVTCQGNQDSLRLVLARAVACRA